MKNKGFTLVELLAVIVILVIILAIAVPSISNVIDNVARSSFESNVKLIFDAIKNKTLEDNTFNYELIDKTNITSTLGIDAVNYKSIKISKVDNEPYVVIAGDKKWANLIASGKKNSIHYDEGVVLWLDAANSNSYPGTGTIWYDLSGNNNNVTLTNGPTYDTNYGGNITFDGVNDYGDFYAPELGTTATIEMWCKIGDVITGKMLMGWKTYDVYSQNGAMGYNTFNADIYGINASKVTSLGIVNNWTHYIFEMRSDVSYTNNKMYINGALQTLTSNGYSEAASNRSFNDGNGRIAGWRNSQSYYMPMSCSNFKVYNRVLTPTEVQTSYNIMKERFGL